MSHDDEVATWNDGHLLRHKFDIQCRSSHIHTKPRREKTDTGKHKIENDVKKWENVERTERSSAPPEGKNILPAVPYLDYKSTNS